MALRTFKQFTITAGGTPQPLIGTTLTAAVSVSAIPVSIAVADSSMFQTGDWALIDVGAAEERVFVLSIPDGTHIKVQSVASAHAINKYVRLGVGINSTYVQTKDGNAGIIFIGTKSTMVTGTMTFCVAKLMNVGAGVQPTEFKDGRSGLANADNASLWWIDGTTNDGYTPSVGVL